MPTVLDRFIPHAMLQVLQTKWDASCSDHSDGFRLHRSAHQAVEQAQQYIAEGYRWVVDLDLEKFFDRVNHDKLMGTLAQYFGHFLSERVNPKRRFLVEGKWATLPSTGEWPMTMVNEILPQMSAVGQPQAKVLATWFATILARRGRVKFRPLSRAGDSGARTIARQFRRGVDGPDVHQRGITVALAPCSEVSSAQEASVLPTSGTQTFGLGPFVNGCPARAERGLEVSTLAVVAVTPRGAFTLAVAQPPPAMTRRTHGRQRQRPAWSFPGSNGVSRVTAGRRRLSVSRHRPAPKAPRGAAYV
jgi:hypothetical protein